MNWNTVYAYIWEQYQHVTILEIIAVAFSVMGVLLSYRNSILLYPAGIISSGLFIWMMAQPKVGLYAEASLNAYYLLMSFYGWYLWLQRNKKATHLPISSCTKRDWKIVIAICVAAFIILYFTLTKWTDSSVPGIDSFVSATAWAGMWLLAKRKVENWILLNISNAVAIPLLFYKHMPLTALLTAFLFTVAVLGYFRWKRIMQKEKEATNALLTV